MSENVSGTGDREIKRAGEKQRGVRGRETARKKRGKKNLGTGPYRVEGTPINMKTTTTVPVMPGTGWS